MAMNSNLIYLNTASCGLVDESSINVVDTFNRKLITFSSHAAEELRDAGLPRIRQTVAKFLNAPAENIALVPNFSYALNAIVQSLRGNEKVMLYRNDYPSVYEPFRINKFDISWIEAEDNFEIDIDAIKVELLSKQIEILVISHVQWMSGFQVDVEVLGDFCAQHNIVFIVDATQSMGAVNIDIDKLKADAVIASNYKWMNAGFGTAVMYMSDDFLLKYPPVIGGNGGYSMVDGEWKYASPIKHYEPGHPNLHGLLLLEGAINKKLELGMAQIEKYNMHLAKKLVATLAENGLELLGSTDMTNRSPIALVKAGEDLQKHLLGDNIVTIYRNGYIRVGVHYYNTEADIEALSASLKRYRKP
ncbi:MAG: aminotransferase class V-fold PLP-dependent enzyme [Sphingobacteriaceae bacterium]|nr:MAG: aminotransferase class V-fold PLP-dependent enzyme [Sphingobacteriaceae bacterium]